MVSLLTPFYLGRVHVFLVAMTRARRHLVSMYPLWYQCFLNLNFAAVRSWGLVNRCSRQWISQAMANLVRCLCRCSIRWSGVKWWFWRPFETTFGKNSPLSFEHGGIRVLYRITVIKFGVLFVTPLQIRELNDHFLVSKYER